MTDLTPNKRLFLFPRWLGQPQSDWYPWLKRELDALTPPPFPSICLASMPNPNQPTIEAWVGRVAELVGDDESAMARTVLIGHSTGCQAIVRYLATLPVGIRVAGVLCVGAWMTVDKPWDAVHPWLETPIDFARVRSAAPRFMVLLSDNDPYTSDFVANKQMWEKHCDAQVNIIAGARHFNQQQEPIVLQTLLEYFT